MPVTRIVLTLLAAAGLFAQQPNTLTPREKAAGWILLFDGKTMKGWEDPAKRTPPNDSVSIDGGTLHVHAHPKVRADLFTQASYQDFELLWEWRVAKGSNTGLKYRVQDRFYIEEHTTDPALHHFETRANYRMTHRLPAPPEGGQEYVVAFEFQLIDNAVFKPGEGLEQRAGSLYDMIPASKDATRPVGEWNRSRLVVKGNHIEHWLNGEKVVDSSLDSAAGRAGIVKRWGADSPIGQALLNAKPEGRLTLQNHNCEAWFRSLKLRKL